MVGIVKVEITVLNILCDAVDLVLRIVDMNLGVRDRHDIDLARQSLFLKERSFAHAHAYVHLGATDMVKCGPHFGTLLVDKQVEIDVDVSS